MFNRLQAEGVADIHFKQDEASGLKAIVAIHSTRRGPAIGGCRFIPYDSDDDAITDALRLARGMSYKAALAGLPHGGGKAVVIHPPGEFNRHALFQAFGRFVDELGGRYITAMDSGTRVEDMDAIATQTRFASCTSDSGDPSPFTAAGVYYGMQAAVASALGRERLADIHVALQGLGNVGFKLAQRLHDAGARLTVSDLDERRCQAAREAFGAQVVAPETLYDVPCDVFAPCGLGAVINPQTLPRLRCRVIAGSANNQLLDPGLGLELQRRGILYAPDYLINAGGLIFVALTHQGRDREAIATQVRGIGRQMRQLLDQAQREEAPTSLIADRMAEAVLAESTPRPH